MSAYRNLAFALAAAGSMFVLSGPASASDVTPWPELTMKSCDADSDGNVTRKEFLDRMARLWDDKHATMMKSDKSMKSGTMTSKQFMLFMGREDPGKIGGG